MTFTIPAEEAKSLIDIEAGVYQAVVQEVGPAEGSFGDQVRFVFAVDGLKNTEGEPADLWAWSSRKLNPKSKLWRWTKVLTGHEPVKDTLFDVEDLVGKRCSLLVVREETDEGVRCKVKDVLVAKQKAAAPDTCSECLADVSYFDAAGVPFCDGHGPRGGKAS